MIARRALLAVAIAALAAIGLAVPASAAGTVTAPVWDTDGDSLFVRSGPGTGHQIVGRLAEGTMVRIECQTVGTVVDGTALWDYLPDYGGYASDRYLYTGYDGRHPDLSECDGAEPPAALTVNGHRLTTAEAANVRWIAANTVPRIGGDLDAAALVTWWSLKEGVLGLDNPHGFSHCDNRRLGPLESCAPQCCWQVGISAVQVPTFDLARTTATAERLYPGWSADQVLAHTATYAGYPPGTPGHDAIVDATGGFRNSWLLRNHGVGFVLNAPQVEAECVVGSLGWCYGTGWDTTARYAPTKAAAMRSVEDLRTILAQLI